MNRAPLRWAGAAALTVLVGVGCPGADNAPKPRPPEFGDPFWSWWGDGRAELSAYDLTYPRYGESRPGTAVAIYVTESFAGDVRVKHEDGRRPDDAVFPVLKLNLMQDFSTGVYDYNLMTSAFVALEPFDGFSAGSATKVSFSSQEWCGQTFAQARFDRNAVRIVSHSYFDGEADREERLAGREGAIPEDGILIWARGLAGPVLAPGESLRVPLLRSLEFSRLVHLPVAWETATLTRSSGTNTVTVPAGEFVVDVYDVAIAASESTPTYPPGATEAPVVARRWTILVERDPPRRVVRWSRNDGLDAVLVGSERFSYWEMNDHGSVRALDRLGLRRRPPRTP